MKPEAKMKQRRKKDQLDYPELKSKRSPPMRQSSMSSNQSMRSNELMKDKARIMAAIFNQNIPKSESKNQGNKKCQYQNQNDTLIDSPPKLPKETNKAKNYLSYV